jgi:hypothetical protein
VSDRHAPTGSAPLAWNEWHLANQGEASNYDIVHALLLEELEAGGGMYAVVLKRLRWTRGLALDGFAPLESAADARWVRDSLLGPAAVILRIARRSEALARLLSRCEEGAGGTALGLREIRGLGASAPIPDDLLPLADDQALLVLFQDCDFVIAVEPRTSDRPQAR